VIMSLISRFVNNPVDVIFNFQMLYFLCRLSSRWFLPMEILLRQHLVLERVLQGLFYFLILVLHFFFFFFFEKLY